MGDLGPQESRETGKAGADSGQASAGSDSQTSLHDKLSADSTPASLNTADLGYGKSRGGDNQFLPAFDMGALALWGQSDSSEKGGAAGSASGSWSAHYAANFDRSDEDRLAAQKLDMSNAIGLPRGTSKEELLRAAKRQEEDLLSQLLEA